MKFNFSDNTLPMKPSWNDNGDKVYTVSVDLTLPIPGFRTGGTASFTFNQDQHNIVKSLGVGISVDKSFGPVNFSLNGGAECEIDPYETFQCELSVSANAELQFDAGDISFGAQQEIAECTATITGNMDDALDGNIEYIDTSGACTSILNGDYNPNEHENLSTSPDNSKTPLYNDNTEIPDRDSHDDRIAPLPPSDLDKIKNFIDKLDQQEDAQEEKSFWDNAMDTVENAYSDVTSWVSGAWDNVFSDDSPESKTANAQGEQEAQSENENEEAREANQEGSTTTEADVTKADEHDRDGDGDSDYNDYTEGGGFGDVSDTSGYGDYNDDSDDGDGDCGEPIVLDLDGDGIELISIDNSNAFYDFSDDSYRENVGWVSSDDALLALDINNDGLIEGSKELAFASYGQIAIDEQDVSRHDFNNDGIVSIHDFDKDGNGMISDLEGLRYFEESRTINDNCLSFIGSHDDGFMRRRSIARRLKDGVIDNRDSVFDSLRVWQDLDSDGVSDTGELDSLASVKGLDGFGISSISLDSNQVTQHLDGNISYGTGAYTTTNNEVKDLGDIAFRASDIGYKENEEDGSISLKSGQQGQEVETRFLGGGDDNFILSATNPNTIAAYGEAGDDIISNNNFNDVLIDGGAGDDTLSGGSGDDWISGGSGADTLSGGAGHDVLFIDNEDVSIDGGAGYDVGELPQSECNEALQSQLLGFGVASEDTNILRSNVSSGGISLLLNGTLTTNNNFILSPTNSNIITAYSDTLSAQLLGFGVASEDTNILRSNVSSGGISLLLNGTLTTNNNFILSPTNSNIITAYSDTLSAQLLGFGVTSEDTNILRSNVSSGVRRLSLNAIFTTNNNFILSSAQLLGFGVASEDVSLWLRHTNRSSLRGVRCLSLNGTKLQTHSIKFNNKLDKLNANIKKVA